MQLPKNKYMRRILAAQLPADFADWLDYVAIISLFTYTWLLDPVYFAWFIVCLTLPYVVIGPFSGALVDRLDVRLVLVLSNLGRAVTTIALAFAGQPEIMLALVALRGVVDSFFSPAKQVAIQSLCEREELSATNGLSFMINQLSKVAGPAVGGALLLIISPQMVFVVNGFISLTAALILMTLPRNIREVKKLADGETKKSMFSDAAEGFSVVFQKPSLWVSILLGAMGFFAIFLHDTLIGPMTRELGFDQNIMGLAIAAVGAGGVAGGFVLTVSKKHIHPYLLIGPSMVIVACFSIGLGFISIFEWSIPSYAFVGAFFLVGVIGAGTFVPLRTVLQLETPPDKMGRVTAVNEITTIVTMLGAPFIGATLASVFELGVPFIAGGSLSFVIGVGALILIKYVKFSDPTTLEEATDLPKAAETN